MVKINGEQVDAKGMTVAQYIQKANFDVNRIVVERNEDIVPKTEYENVVIEDNDVIEVISFVGGG
ncbi:MAG: sulfur carrier protein ThiS [Lachnospiraceae bacterium]|nr:sulfur carrier protein ThiS [Lachnospiraceae bacterium]